MSNTSSLGKWCPPGAWRDQGLVLTKPMNVPEKHVFFKDIHGIAFDRNVLIKSFSWRLWWTRMKILPGWCLLAVLGEVQGDMCGCWEKVQGPNVPAHHSQSQWCSWFWLHLFFLGGDGDRCKKVQQKTQGLCFSSILTLFFKYTCSGLAADITDDVLWPGKQEIQCAVECAASTLRRTLPGVHREVETTPVLEVGLSGFNKLRFWITETYRNKPDRVLTVNMNWRKRQFLVKATILSFMGNLAFEHVHNFANLFLNFSGNSQDQVCWLRNSFLTPYKDSYYNLFTRSFDC